ncbi:DNA-directed RNA polymerase III subunit RPC11 [Acrasis kona]|uniref:DNA-directed RNA polymerase subunit n=1 Tax=Acrasis kona TaxID=1008807 RepID=A0AAW2YSB8_9EUKA
MPFFCPYCCNILLVENNSEHSNQWYCQTCPYVCRVSQKIVNKVKLEKKQVDDVLGGIDKYAPTVNMQCPKCSQPEAYFTEFQTRSADEPMTQFYQCVSCGHQWKIN